MSILSRYYKNVYKENKNKKFHIVVEIFLRFLPSFVAILFFSLLPFAAIYFFHE